MHTSNNDQTGVNLSSILEGLATADINFILVGGLAAVVQGAPVTTMDFFINDAPTTENIAILCMNATPRISQNYSLF